MRLHPNRVNTGVRSPAAGHFLQRFKDIRLFIVERLRPGPFVSHPQPVRETVSSDHPLRAEHISALDRELCNRAATPDSDHIAGLDIAHLGAHVAGWEDIGEEEDLLIRHTFRDPERTYVGEGHPGILSLPAGVSAD